MKHTLIIVVFFANLLYGNINLIDIYREKGIDAVKSAIEQTITQQSYWARYLQNIDTTNGYYESIDYIILCSKHTNNLTIYKYTNHKNHLIYQSDIITGKKDGQKEFEGDLKTPIGTYNLSKKLTKLDPFYGPLALVTTYPNNFDKSYGKTGSGIWIHGFPKSNKRDPYTKGCIALNNNQLIKLDKSIDFKKSTLIIYDTKQKPTLSKNDASLILSQIFLWKKAWQTSDFEKYISFYSPEFKKSNKTNLEQFKQYKHRLFQRNEKKEIQFTKINIIPYPNDLNKKMFKITLFEKYLTKRYKFIGDKTIYIELIDGKMQILNEG